MAQQLIDQRDLDFVIWEQMKAEEILANEKYAEFNKKTCEMILREARAIAIKEILPTLAEGDREGVKFENGVVTTPECFRPVHKKIVEGEWQSVGVPRKWAARGLLVTSPMRWLNIFWPPTTP